jgi:putative FmdB family regulatory protein
MPLYEYKCSNCGKHFDVIQKFSDEPLTKHLECGGGPVERLISAPAFHFKGSGWYVTDYAKTNGSSPGKAEGAGDAKSESKSDGKSESKSEGKTDSKSESKSESKSASKPDSKPSSSTPAPASSGAK